MFCKLICLSIVNVVFSTLNNAGLCAFESGIDGRIVGGDDANIKNFPWQVSLQFRNNHICGGSIISKTYIVTAAYCTDSTSASALTIRVNTTIVGKNGSEFVVKAINQHPRYNRNNIDYDISVLELEQPLTLGDGVQPIKLPTENETLDAGVEVTVTGWGSLSENNSNSFPTLQQVNVNCVSLKECKAAYNQEEITDRMLCAGVPEGGKDACYHDYGGPLEVNKTLWGIVSRRYNCARKEYPGVYSNVTTLRSFIKKITGL